MTKCAEPLRPHAFNFVIVCAYGDWSSFLMLEEVIARFYALEAYDRPEGFFWVEER